MTTTSLRTLAVAALAAALFTACDREAADTFGQKVDRALDATQRKLAAAGHEIAQQTDRAVDAVKSPGDGGSKSVSDTAITASIKTDLLKDPDLSILKIEVDTHDGVVTMNGLTTDEAARTRAERLASGIKGVKEVRNYLVVKRV